MGEQDRLALSPSISAPTITDLPDGLHQPDGSPDVVALIGTWRLASESAVVSKNGTPSTALFVTHCDRLAFAHGTHPVHVVTTACTGPRLADDGIVEDLFVAI